MPSTGLRQPQRPPIRWLAQALAAYPQGAGRGFAVAVAATAPSTTCSYSPSALLSHLISESGQIADLATTIEPDIDADARATRLAFVRRDGPANVERAQPSLFAPRHGQGPRPWRTHLDRQL